MSQCWQQVGAPGRGQSGGTSLVALVLAFWLVPLAETRVRGSGRMRYLQGPKEGSQEGWGICPKQGWLLYPH